MDSRESFKRLSLVAETLNRKRQNQEANGDRTGLNDSRAAEGTGRWSCHYWTAPKNQIHASHWDFFFIYFIGGVVFKAFPKIPISFLSVNTEPKHFCAVFSCHGLGAESLCCMQTCQHFGPLLRGNQDNTISPNTGFHWFYASQLIPKNMFLSPGVCIISFKPLQASLRACFSLATHRVLPSPFSDAIHQNAHGNRDGHSASDKFFAHVSLCTGARAWRPAQNTVIKERLVSRNTLECGRMNKSNAMVQMMAVIKVKPIKNIAWHVLHAPKTIGNVTVMNNLISHTLCPTSTERSATYSWAYLII